MSQPVINPTASDVLGGAHVFDVMVLGSGDGIGTDLIKRANERAAEFHERWTETHVVNAPSLLIESGTLYLWLIATRRDVFEANAILNGEQAAITQVAGAKKMDTLAKETVLPATGRIPPRPGGGPVKGAFGR